MRVIFLDLGIERLPEPPKPATPPPIPEVYYHIAERIKEFEYQNERVLCWVLYHVDRLLVYAHPNYIDKSDAEALLVDAVYDARRFMPFPTPDERYELERWVDFMPDAYEAVAREYEIYTAKRLADHERRSAAAKKGVESRRKKREAVQQ